ncbi:hypothetical protein ACFLQR_02545 [Verrucomicrobiota bacterium]
MNPRRHDISNNLFPMMRGIATTIIFFSVAIWSTGFLYADHPETETQSETNWSATPTAITSTNGIQGTNAVCAGCTAGYSCTGTDEDTKETRTRSRTEEPIYNNECPPEIIGWEWPEWEENDWSEWSPSLEGDDVSVTGWKSSAGTITAGGSFTAPAEGGQYVTITATNDDAAPVVVPPATGSRDDTPLEKTKQVAIIEVASVTADKAVVCVEEDVVFTAITAPGGYEHMVVWTGGGDPATTSGVQTFTTSWTNAGEKTVTAKCGDCGDSGASTNVVALQVNVKYLTFTSDHGVLTDYNTDFAGSGGTVYNPRGWQKDPATNNPISHTQGETISANAGVCGKPPGKSCTLKGDGAGALNFPKTGFTSTGSDQAVPVTASTNLDSKVDILDYSITWTATISNVVVCSSSEVSGSHKIYVTWGTPAGGGYTEKRISWVCGEADGHEIRRGDARNWASVS